MAGVTVCAAICTRDRPEQLRRALHSIRLQTVPPAAVLVVDNAPRDGQTRALLRDEFPEVRYLREPIPGLDFARNRALAESSHDVVAFMDDDAVADQGWVEAIGAAFAQDSEVGVCTGRIAPLELDSDAQRTFEANGGLFASGERRITARRPQPGQWWRDKPPIAWAISLGSGCNLAVRRRSALDLGGFDEALDLGSALPGGGDNDMVWRMLLAGYAAVYEPQARVRHEHRREAGAVRDQIVGHHRAMMTLLGKAAVQTRGAERLPVLAFLGWRLAKPAVRLLRRAAGRDPLPASVLLRSWVACWGGVGSYPLARRVANQRRNHAYDQN